MKYKGKLLGSTVAQLAPNATNRILKNYIVEVAVPGAVKRRKKSYKDKL